MKPGKLIGNFYRKIKKQAKAKQKIYFAKE
jgi:hypothetical protein